MPTPTYAELLADAKSAYQRILNGATFVTVNGQQFHYSSIGELQKQIDWLEAKVAEQSGTDGRGAWEATFDD